MYLVSGTQAERAHLNHVIVMRASNLRRNRSSEEGKEENDDEEEDSSDSDDEDAKPELDCAMIKHHGGVNRLRVRDVELKSHCLSFAFFRNQQQLLVNISRLLQVLLSQ